MKRESQTPPLDADRLRQQTARLRLAMERMIREALDCEAADSLLGNREYRRAAGDQIPAYHS